MTLRNTLNLLGILLGMHAAIAQADHPVFDKGKDLLLAHYDCKTDVDDLHSVAALATLLEHHNFEDVQYHAVAGAYGVQEGLYVPPNSLFEAAFGTNWSDAHTNFDLALETVTSKVLEVLDAGGNIWIPEAGQSDFTAALTRKVRELRPGLDTTSRIHVVQHSDWNEEVTGAENLAYAKEFTSYHKIPDGNAMGNGTPGFRSDDEIAWMDYVDHPHLVEIWKMAIEIGNQYNGQDGRYLNASIAAGGLDFSDTSEVCWIFGIEHLKDAEAFFSFLE